MATNAVTPAVAYSEGLAELLAELASREGSVARPGLRHVASRPYIGGAEAARDLTDAAHFIAGLHGRHPGLVDHASRRFVPPAAEDWMEATIAGFSRERAYLAHVVAAAGPLPSTPGHAACEAAALGQQHALDMLAQSERRGCALGAAFALVLDWRAIRQVIDDTARRFGVEQPVPLIPSPAETQAVAAAISEGPAIDRAVMFGAEQLLVQHRGLWDLLEARQQARRSQ